MSQQVPISIKLCNRTYRVKVASENEATVRSIAQAINDKLNEIKKGFPGRDDHDYLAMTLIDYITSAQEKKPTNNFQFDEITIQLTTINNLLDE